MNDVVAIDINTLREVPPDEISCKRDDTPMPLLKVYSRPNNRKDSATDLVGILDHGGLGFDVEVMMTSSGCSQELGDGSDQVRDFELGCSVFVKDVSKGNSKTLTQTRSTRGAGANGQHTGRISF